MRIVSVADLPGLHNPFRCGRREAFESVLRQAVVADARHHSWEVWRPRVDQLVASMNAERAQALTRDARERWSPAELADCRQACAYHQVDWTAISEAACRLVEPDVRLDEAAIEDAAGQFAGPEHEFFQSLFYEPIKWWPAAGTLSNGQHRACGLALARAERVPVAPGPEALGARDP